MSTKRLIGLGLAAWTVVTAACAAGAAAESGVASTGVRRTAGASSQSVVLRAGRSLRHEFRRPAAMGGNGSFTLYVDPGAMELEQEIHLKPVWTVQEATLSVRDTSRVHHPGPTALTLRRSGNLVLHYGDGHVFWQTHTAGTSANRLVLTGRGALRLLTQAGNVVWSSHTTPVLLGPGLSMPSGMTWRAESDLTYHPHRASLEMRRSGDLVLRRAGRTLWSSDTHVRGAHLTMRRGGNLEIVTSGGRVVWQSHTGGHSYPAYLALCIANTQIDVGHQELFGHPFTTESC